MSYYNKLKNCVTIHDLASILAPQNSSVNNITATLFSQAASLSYVLYKIPNDEKYTIFRISKKSGGEREIKAPCKKLKFIQKKLACVLAECAEEIEEGRSNPKANKNLKSLSHGFKKHHSIATNASCHKNKRYVFNLDLENYFQSFNFGRVRGFFIKNKDFLLPEKIATIIAQIACHDNELPQGSPCSPIITNLITHKLDVRLARLAKKHKLFYSRYADDITFSTNQKFFPKELAAMLDEETCKWKVSVELEDIIIKSGFSIKHSKTRMQYKESRQSVTGLIVNRGVNVRSEYYRYARSMGHSLFRRGEFFLPETKKKGSINQLEGILSHIHNIKDFSDLRDEKEKKSSPKSSTTLYEDFLRYKCFFASELPLIICEGKTDSIYMQCAIELLSNNNKNLIEIANGKLLWKIKFHNYINKTKGELNKSSNLLQLYGGSGGLKILIRDYRKHYEKIKCSIPKHPVILLVDNDDGANELYAVLKEIISPSIKKENGKKKSQKEQNQQPINGMEKFYFVVNNLYIVPTPKASGSKSKIEDFFDKSITDTKINGKIFNPENTQSGNNGEYGKYIFATKVVKPNKAKINFEKFQPILSNITSVIEDYKSRITAQ
jgi:RNA-directed DNA polymerase